MNYYSNHLRRERGEEYKVAREMKVEETIEDDESDMSIFHVEKA